MIESMENLLIAAGATFVGMFILVPILFGLTRMFGVYAIVQERQCRVYVLFGKVRGVLDEPGLYFLWKQLGLAALIVNWLGECHVLDMRLDQEYLRSQPVNSEEGAPWASGSGTRCSSATRWPTCSKMPILAARWRRTWATRR